MNQVIEVIACWPLFGGAALALRRLWHCGIVGFWMPEQMRQRHRT